MARRVVTGVLLAGIAGLGLIAAQASAHGPFGPGGWGGHGRWSALSSEDREAFTDARIAALHAGLKLNTDQEKLWPPIETALRDMAKQREARREGMRERRELIEKDAPAALRGMADATVARGEALRKLADATAPLYATLDEGQKRRAMILARPMGPHRGFHGGPGWRRGGPPDEAQ